MGDHAAAKNLEDRRKLTQHLLRDIEALELMLERDLIEHAPIRIGAEQEFCLVDKNWRPAPIAADILAQIDDPRFTTELAKYNLEINLDPMNLKGACFTDMEYALKDLLSRAQQVADQYEAKILLTGILPSISMRELEIDFMTDHQRYYMLNEMMRAARRGPFHLNIKGVDELQINHDSVMFEACNTSFQTHLQVDPDDFIPSYNWAQTIAGPVLSVAANSPLLLGRELWSETRIAIFQQSIDTRSSSQALTDQLPRVAFGRYWAKGTIADIFKDDIAQYKIILNTDIEEDALQVLAAGGTPRLRALNFHNGTVYRWNRPCFGMAKGKAHVRIENRYLPAGPTPQDQMANFCFWAGLMAGRPQACDDMPSQMDFKYVKSNFIRAARTGKESIMHWMGKDYAANVLIRDILLPIAYDGLRKSGVSMQESQHFLDIIDQRSAGQTADQWIIKNYRNLKNHISTDEALIGLTQAMYFNEKENAPVHQWLPIHAPFKIHEEAIKVGHVMSTQLLRVQDKDLANLATRIMQWKNIHHLPVENEKHELAGIITWKHVQKFQEAQPDLDYRLVEDIMIRKVLTASAETSIKAALQIMLTHEIGCLPVVERNRLIGIVTVKDLIIYDHAEGTQ